ncbi:MAG: hypothetical protein ACLR0U_09035 [Enterocloster clostridioformis]
MSIYEKSGFASPEELGAARDGPESAENRKPGKPAGNSTESDFIIAQAATRYLKAKDISKLPASKALQDEIEQHL